ncbi:MAG TPA: hypothetical protein VL359_11295, partial [bacterium]|nr:hypothetical protein [bacterium]
METTPLPAAAKSGRPEAAAPQRVVSLVSNAPAADFTDIDGFLKAFNSPEARAEIAPFRFVIQRRARRSLGGKFSKGLTQEVTENIEVNPIEDLFGLRRWLGAIRQDPACVMLLGISKIKEEALAAPLVFSDLLRSGRPILVAGADSLVQDQLFSTIDVNFATVPPVVAANSQLRQSLLVRAQRKKGFVASVRVLLDLEGLPKPVTDKLHALNTGADSKPLSDAEIVNLCLLADLCTRYMPSIRQFKEAVRNAALQLPQLVSMFEILTADLSLEQAVEAFKGYLSEQAADPANIKNRGQLFGEVYRYLQESQGQGARVGNAQQKTDDFFRSLASVVILFRAQADPGLWRRCCFLGARGATEQSVLNSQQPCLNLLTRAVEQGPAALTPQFQTQLGEAIFTLVQLANLDPAQAKSEQELERITAASRLLPLFAMQHFPAAGLVHLQDKNRETLLNKEKFLGRFQKVPLAPQELRAVKNRLQRALNPDESAAVLVRKATLDVLLGHARQREKVLRDIY